MIETICYEGYLCREYIGDASTNIAWSLRRLLIEASDKDCGSNSEIAIAEDSGHNKVDISKLILIIYDLYKIDIDDKKLLKELSSNILEYIKKLLKELIDSITSSDLIS